MPDTIYFNFVIQFISSHKQVHSVLSINDSYFLLKEWRVHNWGDTRGPWVLTCSRQRPALGYKWIHFVVIRWTVQLGFLPFSVFVKLQIKSFKKKSFSEPRKSHQITDLSLCLPAFRCSAHLCSPGATHAPQSQVSQTGAQGPIASERDN